jgi:FAD-dependent monooxygenase
LLIHFKSKDLTRLHKQGQFWHIFFLGGGKFVGAIIAQDETDTWTTHLQLPLEVDPDTISSEDAVYQVLGGCGSKYEIKIDEILVRSTFRPSIAVARQYASPNKRIYLVGDAAHQNIPTGGYGMNMGLGDAFDLGWKLAMVMNGQGGLGLLKSYESERRPVAIKTIERSGVHAGVHLKGASILSMSPEELDSPAGKAAQEQTRKLYQDNDGENRDLGIEMDYRYTSSSICIPSPGLDEPAWIPSAYTPSTFPGSRAPHVFLKDGTPIFDKYGKHFTLVAFSDEDADCAKLLLEAGAQHNVPIERVALSGEDHAYKVWGGIPFVLVRPDGHVAWRGSGVSDAAAATAIIQTVAGFAESPSATAHKEVAVPETAFTSTAEMTTQDTHYELRRMGEFQV